MPEPNNPSSGPASPDTWQWAMYVREDIQDLRSDVRDIHRRMDERFGRMDERFARVDERLDALTRRIDTRFTWTITTMLAIAGLMSGLMTALIKL